ncbi:MAG: alpha-2-macroglobulin family protein [Verrucomicrobiales bacterium]
MSLRILPLFCFISLLFSTGPSLSAEISARPSSGNIHRGLNVFVRFDQAMVAPEAIDQDDQPTPLLFSPELESNFRWISPSEGYVRIIGELRPNTDYTLNVIDGLTDLAGNPVTSDEPIAIYQTRPFTVTRSHGFYGTLPAEAPIHLAFSYPVKPEDVVKNTTFLERESRQSIPVEVTLSWDENTTPRDALQPGTHMSVRPRTPLLPGKSYDLIIEPLQEVTFGESLPFTQRLSLGEAGQVAVDWVGAFHFAGQSPHISIRLNEQLDEEKFNSQMVSIEPAVENLRITPEGRTILLEGDFDWETRYTITIREGLPSTNGFTLTKDSQWGASFQDRQASIIFPQNESTQRSARGLNFAFLQSNTLETEWRLARVPMYQLETIQNRLREFRDQARSPLTGHVVRGPDGAKPQPTTVLIDELGLEVVARGTTPATEPNHEELRSLQVQPEGSAFAGAYLLEVTTQDREGRTLGNRSLIYFTDVLATLKTGSSENVLRVARMDDNSPIAGAEVQLLTIKNELRRQVTTDEMGLAVFPVADWAGSSDVFPRYFLIRENGRTHLQEAMPSSFHYAYGSGRFSGHRSLVVTDRPVYRPGHLVKLKGIHRYAQGMQLAMPKPQSIDLQIQSGWSGPVVHQQQIPLSEFGSWEAEWFIPENAAPNTYTALVNLSEGEQVRNYFRVEEYRPPLFDVRTELLTNTGARSDIQVHSSYFHGSPNAGAKVRWTASWNSIGGWDWEFRRTDAHSVGVTPPEFITVEVTGEAELDADGSVTLQSEPPFEDGVFHARTWVDWRVDVLSAEGQTITSGSSGLHQISKAYLGVRASQAFPENEEETSLKIDIHTSALDAEAEEIQNYPLIAEVHHVTYRSVKEELAPFIVRWQNHREGSLVETLEIPDRQPVQVTVAQPGEYVVRLRPKNQADAPVVSDRVYVSGGGSSYVYVEHDHSLKMSLEKSDLTAGENAVLTVQSPFLGQAWVTVEAEDILDHYIFDVAGNTSRLEIPIKASYAPNATIAVYLVRPGGEDRLPAERFGTVEVNIDNPSWLIELEHQLETRVFEPRQKVEGTILAMSQGQAVSDAEVTVLAVDDAILRLGGWTLPQLIPNFYPYRSHSIQTRMAIGQLSEGINPRDITEKGFVIGDGGDEMLFAMLVRENFQPLAYWAASLRTNALGKADFSFDLPDSLTTFRIIALAHTRDHRFGSSDSEILVQQKLMVEPALPRFLRNGDEFELRTVVRQNQAERLPVEVSVRVEGAIELLDSSPQLVETIQGVGKVVTFPARVTDTGTEANIEFQGSAGLLNDAVKLTIPVRSPTIVRREAFGGALTPDETPDLPSRWAEGTGEYRMAVSTSPWMPMMSGLPVILDYPHGCFEQVSTRMLTYSLLGELMAYLPDGEDRLAHLNELAVSVLKKFDQSIDSDGFLPYWPGGNRNYTTSAMGAWMLLELDRINIDVPENLRDRINAATQLVAENKGSRVHPFARALALYVLTQRNIDPAKQIALAEAMYEHRETWPIDARALLALSIAQLNALPDQLAQLQAEIQAPLIDRGFDPESFGSVTRDKAIRVFARATLGGDSWTPQARAESLELLTPVLNNGAAFSTQENLWSLLAFRTILQSEGVEPLSLPSGFPTPDRFAPLRNTAEWTLADYTYFARLVQQVSGHDKAKSYLANATYRLPRGANDERANQGLHLERVVHNLTNPERVGTQGKPAHIGDEILVTYRLHADEHQFYLALEDPLPAGLETVNPKLDSVAEFYRLPETTDSSLGLSHSELRDDRTNLYFDRVAQGAGVSRSLARATSVGNFAWPPAQVSPMYDARFFSIGVDDTFYVVEP